MPKIQSSLSHPPKAKFSSPQIRKISKGSRGPFSRNNVIFGTPDILIKAFMEIQCQLNEARLLIVGDEDLKPKYQASSSLIAGKVIFAGNVDDKELPNYYSASDLLVLPSVDRSEGFGLTLLEANATEKPVVASNVGGMPSVVAHEVNGLLVPLTEEKALAETIKPTS